MGGSVGECIDSEGGRQVVVMKAVAVVSRVAVVAVPGVVVVVVAAAVS